MLSVRKGSPFTGDRKGRPYSATGSRAEAVGAGLAPARRPPLRQPFWLTTKGVSSALRNQRFRASLKLPLQGSLYGKEI